MKVCVIQPPYSYDERDMAVNFDKILSMLDECDETLDLIVLPEYSDIPADTADQRVFHAAIEKNGPVLLARASETAKRCRAILCVNAMSRHAGGYRNTTHVFDREGRKVGAYDKAHPAPSEVKSETEGGHALDVAYSYEARAPYVLEIDGLRFGFLTCYDFYFYEYFPKLAKEKLDIIIGCSLQRTDSHDALSIIGRFLCYQTNAYLVRASVSLGEESAVCGCSMVVSPKGEELLNMKSRAGLGICEIDPTAKFYKAAGHKGALKAHHEYMEEGRRPWLYRNGGAGTALFERVMPYPRICAHRGFNTVAPENTMPAFGAAVALGAQEIEFDLWSTKDGVLVSAHDPRLERVSNGTGYIFEHTYAELAALDFGVGHGDRFKGLSIATFEEILKQFGGRCVMNIHVKIWDEPYLSMTGGYMEEIVSLLRRYDCTGHAYFMSSNEKMLEKAMAYAPDVAVCVGWNGDHDKMSMVERAVRIGARKIQLFKPHFDEETVRAAHAHGIRCNVFFADDPEEARRYREMGIDTILTNDYLSIKNALGE